MAQNTDRDSVPGGIAKAGDMAQDIVERSSETADAGLAATTDVIAAGSKRMLDAVEDLAGKAPSPMVRLVLDRAAPAMQDMVKAETDLVAFWLEMSRDHAQRTMDTMQRVAGARSMREAFELQSEYLRESMAQMAEAVSRQLNVARTLTSSMFDAGRNLKDAA